MPPSHLPQAMSKRAGTGHGLKEHATWTQVRLAERTRYQTRQHQTGCRLLMHPCPNPSHLKLRRCCLGTRVGVVLFVVLFYIIIQPYVAANHTPLSQCPGSPATKSWLSKSSKVNFYRWWRISVPLECAPTPAALRHTPATASSHTTTKAVTQSHRHKRQITQKTLKQTKDQK